MIKGDSCPTRRKYASKQNRGRRAKSECKNLHYQKTKIQGVGRSHRLLVFIWLILSFDKYCVFIIGLSNLNFYLTINISLSVYKLNHYSLLVFISIISSFKKN